MKPTRHQERVLESLPDFLEGPETHWVLHGSAGTGKSMVAAWLADSFDKYQKMLRFMEEETPWHLIVTATTNQAAAVLARLIERAAGRPKTVQTIHSLLALYPVMDETTGEEFLVQQENGGFLPWKSLILVDEASMVDETVFSFIEKARVNAKGKVILIGDPHQLAHVKEETPFFQKLMEPHHHPEDVELKWDIPKNRIRIDILFEVMRNRHAIRETARRFKALVADPEAFGKRPALSAIIETAPELVLIHNSSDWFAAIDKAFQRCPRHTRILAWRNERVIRYNRHVRTQMGGTGAFLPGERVISNHYIKRENIVIYGDSLVDITEIRPSIFKPHGVDGYDVKLAQGGNTLFFLPRHMSAKYRVLRRLREEERFAEIKQLQETWLDLRDPFASTIHKAQGATFDTVFIDFEDISRCLVKPTLFRLLYVAFSRARKKIYCYV